MTLPQSTRPGALTRIVITTLALLVVLLPSVPLLVAAETAGPESAAVTRDPRFGLNDAFRIGDRADAAGAGWSRILFWWSDMQKQGPGALDMFATEQDHHINAENARGRQLAAAVLNVPAWASTDGTPNGVPKNLYLPYDHPDNHWGQFMRKMAEHYRGRIDTWIIWNEVDVPHGQWKTWHGSIEDFAQLQKVAYRAIKAGNPNATVAPFGAAWWYDHGAALSRFLDALAADPEAAANNHYFDVANLHLYSGTKGIPRIVTWYREQMAARGMGGKAVWIGETNAIPWDDPVWKAPKANLRATMDEQSSYIIEAFATFMGVGVERFGVNRSTDGADFEAGGEPFGLIRNDGSSRPAFTAYQVATRYFAGAREASYSEPVTSGVTRVVLEKPGERVTVLWTMQPSATAATVTAIGSGALKVNKYGETETVSARDGRYEFQLAPATANSNEHDRAEYVVGGDPVILVERTDGGMAAARPLDVAPVPTGEAARPAALIVAETTPTPRSTGRAAPTPTPTPKKR